jgi:hypothetical protein
LIQKLVDFCYRHPRSELKKYKRFGGYFNYRQMVHNRKLMAKASVSLPPAQSYPDGLPIYFLTGKDYLYQTLFCIRSLAKTSTGKFRFILADDGSFDKQIINRIEIQLPGAVIFKKKDIDVHLQGMLPFKDYPILHHKREVYPHIKKLTDVHCLPGNNWKLVLDSDMLFWNEPAAMIGWLRSPGKPLHMIDCEESYGYSEKLMQDLSGERIRGLINVGAIGLNSNQINWGRIEQWVGELEEREGTSYYLEQALTAMIIGGKETIVLNSSEYIVNPGKHSKGTLHHYVDLSKALYFNEMWQKLV